MTPRRIVTLGLVAATLLATTACHRAWHRHHHHHHIRHHRVEAPAPVPVTTAPAEAAVPGTITTGAITTG